MAAGPIQKLHAKLAVEVRCPACGARNSFFLLSPPPAGSKARCNDCRAEFAVAFAVAPSSAKVGLRYLELALDKWVKEFALVFGKLEGTDIVIDEPAPRSARSSDESGDSGSHRVEAELAAALAEAEPPTEPPPQRPLPKPRGQADGAAKETLGEDVPDEDLGRLTSYRKGTGAGVEEIRELLKNDPHNRQMKEWLAFALYTNDLQDDAINTYLELIEEDDRDPISHFYLANCYFRRGYADAAREEWTRVMDLAPDSHLARKAAERVKKPQA